MQRSIPSLSITNKTIQSYVLYEKEQIVSSFESTSLQKDYLKHEMNFSPCYSIATVKDYAKMLRQYIPMLKFIWTIPLLNRVQLANCNDVECMMTLCVPFIVTLKGYTEITGDRRPQFSYNPRFLHFGNGIRCMNLTLKGIVKIFPRLITKRH